MNLSRVLPFSAASLLLTIGCGGGSGPIVLPPGSASNIYVVQNPLTASDLNTILEFPANLQGSVTPENTITMSKSSLYAVAVDASGNLYAATDTISNPSPTQIQILVYAPGATGAATPTRTITTTLSSSIDSIAVDSIGQIYALSENTINIFSANATGKATPIRQITSSLINHPYAMAVDSANNIYVATGYYNPNIVVFSAAANGDIESPRTITGSNTQLGYVSLGIAVDATGDIFVATQSGTSPYVSTVLEFAPNANGNAVPIKTLTAVSSYAIGGIKVDTAGNLFVVVENIGNLRFAVDVFLPTATDSDPPVETISSAAWTYSSLGQLAIQ